MASLLDRYSHVLTSGVLADSTVWLSLILVACVLLLSKQLALSLAYYPHSIRHGKSKSDLQAIGNIPLQDIFMGMVSPRFLKAKGSIDGVFYPEALAFVGIVPLLAVFHAGFSFWTVLLLFSVAMAMGNRFLLYGLLARTQLRIPARWTYFAGVSIVMISIPLIAALRPQAQKLLLFLLSVNLAVELPALLPMQPYVQRWMRPSVAFGSTLKSLADGAFRVSGLPYPMRTGQIQSIITLGYNGGSQLKWMSDFRNDSNPNGSGAHDWFMTQGDSEKLDQYGVLYAYTYRPLKGKWIKTQIPHLYLNTHAHYPYIKWPVPC